MIGAIEYGCDTRTKRVFVRCFQLSCSPEPALSPPPDLLPKRRGRPKKYANAAERQREYNRRKKEKIEKVKAEQDRLAQIAELTRSKAVDGLFIMSDADHSKGLLVTGGYDYQKIDVVDAASKTDTGRVTPKGHAPPKDKVETSEKDDPYGEEQDIKAETESTFFKKHGWKLKLSPKQLLLRDLVRNRMFFFCKLHSICETHTPGARLDSVSNQWVLEFLAQYDRKAGLWRLDCGCTRGLCIPCGSPFQPKQHEKRCTCARSQNNIVTAQIGFVR